MCKFIPSDPVTPLLAIYPKEVFLKQKKKVMQRILTAALSTQTKSKNKCKTYFKTIFYLILNPKGSLSDFFFLHYVFEILGIFTCSARFQFEDPSSCM